MTNELIKCSICQHEVGERFFPDLNIFLCATCTRAFRLGQQDKQGLEGLLVADYDTGTRFRMMKGRYCPYCLSPVLKVWVDLHGIHSPCLDYSCGGCGQQWRVPVSLGAFYTPPFPAEDPNAPIPV